MRFLFIFLLILNITTAQTLEPKLSTYFQYQGYSEPAYKSFQKNSQYVTLSDETKLAIDVFIPTNGPEKKSYPTVFMFTPYNRAYFFPKMGLLKHSVSAITGNGWGPVYDMSGFDYGETLLAHGYAFAVADMRGTGASFGSQMPLMPQIGKDGKELIDWMASQEWCDGNVGMMGPSYLGWAQFIVAAQKPEALKCIMPEVIGFDIFTAANRPGGIAATRWLTNFSERLEGFNKSTYDFKKFVLPPVPAYDEDGDGKYIDERPLLDSLMLQGKTPLKYADNEIRKENVYFSAIQEHLNNIPVSQFLDKNMGYFDSHAPAPYDDLTFSLSNPGYYIPELSQSKIPIYHIGGWLDGFVKGTTKLYASLADQNPSKLMISPRTHFPRIPKAYLKFQNYKESYSDQLITEQLRFFDYHLKGIENKIMDEPPVHIYVMNKGWISGNSWPLSNSSIQNYYFTDDQGLSSTALETATSETAIDSQKVDFSHSSSYGKGGINRWLMYTLGPKEVMDRTNEDQKCIIYETPPLEQEMEVVGHPVINFWASSNQDYGDFFVYLTDVDEKGNAIYVTEGQLRAGWHKLHPPTEQIEGRAEVKPDLPWHGYKKNQWHDSALANDEVLELRFDLQPIAWAFKPGHKIRIAIANVDKGNFELNHNLCPDGECPETIIHIHRSEKMLSRIELPILSKESDLQVQGQ